MSAFEGRSIVQATPSTESYDGKPDEYWLKITPAQQKVAGTTQVSDHLYLEKYLLLQRYFHSIFAKLKETSQVGDACGLSDLITVNRSNATAEQYPHLVL